MRFVWTGLAASVGAAHVSLIVLLTVGGPLGLRDRRVLRIHLPAMVATAGVFIVGADCPLTVAQKALLRRAGHEPYRGGFIEHYLIEPITGHGATAATTLVVMATWMVPTVLSYGTIIRRWSTGSSRRQLVRTR